MFITFRCPVRPSDSNGSDYPKADALNGRDLRDVRIHTNLVNGYRGLLDLIAETTEGMLSSDMLHESDFQVLPGTISQWNFSSGGNGPGSTDMMIVLAKFA